MPTNQLPAGLTGPAIAGEMLFDLAPGELRIIKYTSLPPQSHTRPIGVVYRRPGGGAYYVAVGNLALIPQRLVEEVNSDHWPAFNAQYAGSGTGGAVHNCIYERRNFDDALRTLWTLVCRYYGSDPGPYADALTRTEHEFLPAVPGGSFFTILYAGN